MMKVKMTKHEVVRAVLFLMTLLTIMFGISLMAQAREWSTLENSFVDHQRVVEIQTFVSSGKLSKAQKIFYLTGLALEDYRQTTELVIKHPNQYYEMNPLLGKHPTRQSLIIFGSLGIAATALIGRIGHPIADMVVDSIIATEQLNVWENQHSIKKRSSMPLIIAMSFQF